MQDELTMILYIGDLDLQGRTTYDNTIRYHPEDWHQINNPQLWRREATRCAPDMMHDA